MLKFKARPVPYKYLLEKQYVAILPFFEFIKVFNLSYSSVHNQDVLAGKKVQDGTRDGLKKDGYRELRVRKSLFLGGALCADGVQRFFFPIIDIKPLIEVCHA